MMPSFVSSRRVVAFIALCFVLDIPYDALFRTSFARNLPASDLLFWVGVGLIGIISCEICRPLASQHRRTR